MMVRERWRAVAAIVFIGAELACAAAAQAAGIDRLAVAGRDATHQDYLELSAPDLREGQIVVEGGAAAAAKVLYSLDGGGTWVEATGVDPFTFTFQPRDGDEYAVVVRAVDAQGASLGSRVVVVRYARENLRAVFEELFERIRVVYVGERLQELLTFFASEEYPNFTTFKQNMQDTFDKSTNFILNISIRQVELRVDHDLAIVRVDWDKTFETNSKQSGRSNEIHFRRINGVWKITFIRDDTIFVVGTGSLNATA